MSQLGPKRTQNHVIQWYKTINKIKWISPRKIHHFTSLLQINARHFDDKMLFMEKRLRQRIVKYFITVEFNERDRGIQWDLSKSHEGAGGHGRDAGQDVVELGGGVVGERPAARVAPEVDARLGDHSHLTSTKSCNVPKEGCFMFVPFKLPPLPPLQWTS